MNILMRSFQISVCAFKVNYCIPVMMSWIGATLISERNMAVILNENINRNIAEKYKIDNTLYQRSSLARDFSVWKETDEN